jgi:hypothetical protein
VSATTGVDTRDEQSSWPKDFSWILIREKPGECWSRNKELGPFQWTFIDEETGRVDLSHRYGPTEPIGQSEHRRSTIELILEVSDFARLDWEYCEKDYKTQEQKELVRTSIVHLTAWSAIIVFLLYAFLSKHEPDVIVLFLLILLQFFVLRVFYYERQLDRFALERFALEQMLRIHRRFYMYHTYHQKHPNEESK